MWILTINGIEYVASEGREMYGFTDMHCMNSDGLVERVVSYPTHLLKHGTACYTSGHHMKLESD